VKPDELASLTPIPLKTTHSKFFRGPKGGVGQKKRVFIGYRFDFDDSQHFRDMLGDRLEAQRTQSLIQIVDGRVPVGTSWPKTIRTRIKAAQLFVADATGLRSDVAFEMGFAYGLGTPVMPVLLSRQARTPEWLRGTQVGFWSDEGGRTRLVTDITNHVSGASVIRPQPKPEAIPGLSVLLGEEKVLDSWRGQFDHASSQSGLTGETYTAEEVSRNDLLLKRAASASLLLCVFNNSTLDTLLNFVCGAIVSRPGAGYQGREKRQVRVANARPGDLAESVATSLLQCSQVDAMNADLISSVVRSFGHFHAKWVRGSS
jgi:hypothetical protein